MFFLGVLMTSYINGLRWLLEIFKKKLGSFYPYAQPRIYGYIEIILSFKRVLQILIPALS